MAGMTFEYICESLRRLHYEQGRDAALIGLDRGLCPHHFSPDKENWETGYDSIAAETNARHYYTYDEYF
jgi:hypothetical protein